MMHGLRFERRDEGNYYKVILHIGSTYVPVNDEDIEALKKTSETMGDGFLEFFLDRVGYSSYLKEQLKSALLKSGERPAQLATLRQAIREL